MAIPHLTGIKLIDGSASAPALAFNSDTNTGIYWNTYSGDAKQLNIATDGTVRASFNSAGITSNANFYTASGGSFRNYSGVWKGTTGVSGNGFQFVSVDATAMTLSSTGDALFAGEVQATTYFRSAGTLRFRRSTNTWDAMSMTSNGKLELASGGANDRGEIYLHADHGSTPRAGVVTFENESQGTSYLFTDTNKRLKFHTSDPGEDDSLGNTVFYNNFPDTATFAGNISLTDGAKIGVNGGETITIGKITGSGAASLTLSTSTTATSNFTIDNTNGLKFGSTSGANRLLANTGSTFEFGKEGSGLGNYQFTSNVGSVTFLNSNNVGIGTASPSQKLHVVGNGIFEAPDTSLSYPIRIYTNKADSNDRTSGILFNTGYIDPSRGKGALVYDYVSSNAWNRGDFHFLQNTAGNNSVASLADSVLTIKNSGNVGIGTTSPGEKLDVAGTNVGIKINGTQSSRVYYNRSGTYTWSTGLRSGDTKFHIFDERSGDRVVIDDTGNVGIGAASPSQKLHVVGTQIRLDNNGGSGGYYLHDGSGTFRAALWDNGTNTRLFADGNGSTAALTIDSNNATFAGTISSGNITSTGTLTINGHSTLGDATSDTTNITGNTILNKKAASGTNISILKLKTADGSTTWNVGGSNTGYNDFMIWAPDLGAGNYFQINKSTGTATFGGHVRLNAGKALRLYNTAGNGWAEVGFNESDNLIQVQRGIVASSDSALNLGSSSVRWANVYADTLYGDGSNLTGVTVSNADTVDNLHASSFIRSDADDTASGVYTLTNSTTAATIQITGHAGASNYNYFLNASNDGGNKAVHFVNGSTRTSDGGANAYVIRNDGGKLILGHASHETNIKGSSFTVTPNATFAGVTTIGPGTTGTPYDSTTFLHVKGTTRSIVQQSSTADAYYMFGDAGANNAAWVGYNHSSGSLSLQAQSSVTINKNTNVSGSVTATSLDINGNADISGNLSLSGAGAVINQGTIYIQDTAGGRIGWNRNTSNGAIHNSGYNAFQTQVNTSGTDGKFEIQAYTGAGVYGGSFLINVSAQPLINDYILHNGDENTKIGFSGSDTFIVNTGGTTALTVDSSQNATFAGDIMPSADSTHNIGSNAVKWAEGHFDHLYIGETGNNPRIDIYTENETTNIADSFADTTTDKSYIYFNAGTSSNDPGYIMHENSNSEHNEGVLHLVPSDDNGTGDYVSIHGTNDPDVLKLHTSGLVETVNLQLQLKSGSNGVYLNDLLMLGGHINADTDSSYDIGSNGTRFATVYADYIDGGNSTLLTSDASNYFRINTSGGSAQLGLFRTGSSAGGGYIGIDVSKFRIYNSSFAEKFSVDISSGAVVTPSSVTATGLDINGNADISGTTYLGTTNYDGLLTWTGSDYASAINLSEGNISNGNEIQAYEFKQRATGEPRNNLGDPTVTEMALFEQQFKPQTTLANDYNDLTDLKFYKQDTSSSSWTEVTSYSDDQKRKFLRTNNSSVIIPNTTYKFRVEFKAKNYTFANALSGYWSSQSHRAQVHVWKFNYANDAWTQHTSSTTEISSWPGHMYLPFSNIPWHETNTTSTGHYRYIRIEFTPNWIPYSGSGSDYSDRDIAIYGLQIWGGYPSGRRTVHSYDQNGKMTLFGDLHAPGNITLNGSVTANGTVLTGDQTLPTASSLGAVTLTDNQTISGAKTFSNNNNHYKGHLYYDAYDSNGNHYPHYNDGSNGYGANINIRHYYGSSYKTHVMSSDSSGNMQFDFQGTLKGDALTVDGNSDLNGDLDVSGNLTGISTMTIPSKLTVGSNNSSFSHRVDVNTTSDVKMRFYTPSTDSTDWSYLEFYKRDGNRSSYFGINGSGDPIWAVNDGGPYIKLDEDATYDIIAGGNLAVTGNLQVNGTTTTVNQTNLDVSDNIIGLNRGSSSNANDSGIVIERGSTGDNAAFLWDESADKFVFGTTTATASSTGDISFTPVAFGGKGLWTTTSAVTHWGPGVDGTAYGTLTWDTGYAAVHANGSNELRLGSGSDTDAVIISGSNMSVAGNITHNGLTMTSGSDIDQLYEANLTLQLAAETWTDTGINSNDLATGTYAVQMYVSDFNVSSPGHYYEYYSGMMSWYGSGTNATHEDEIPLHRAGHSPNNGHMQLKTVRHASGGDNLMLQIKSKLAYSAALDNSDGGKIIRFKFRRLI